MQSAKRRAAIVGACGLAVIWFNWMLLNAAYTTGYRDGYRDRSAIEFIRELQDSLRAAPPRSDEERGRPYRARGPPGGRRSRLPIGQGRPVVTGVSIGRFYFVVIARAAAAAATAVAESPAPGLKSWSMTDAEFDAAVRDVQRRIAADMYEARRERRIGETSVRIRYQHGTVVRPVSVVAQRDYDVRTS